MSKIRRPNNISFSKVTLYAFLILLALSCNRQNTPNSNSSDELKNDSIFTWIKQINKNDIPIEEKALILKKAHLAADKSPNDPLKPSYFSKLSLAYLKLEDSLQFRTTNRQSMQLSKKVNDSITLAEAHWDLGTFFKNNVIPDSAYYNYREAHLLYDGMGDTYFSARMLYNMANSQVDVKDYTGAEINAFKAIKLLKPLDKNRQLYNSYTLLGAISNEFKEYNRSLGYFVIAGEYSNKIQDEEVRNRFYFSLQNNIGNVYQEQEQYEKAIPYYENALKNDRILSKKSSSYARHLDNLAYCRLKAGDTLNVKSQLLEALAIEEEERDIAGAAKSHYGLAEFYLLQGDREGALENAKKAEKFAQQSSSNDRLLKSLGLLARIDEENTLKHSLDYMKLSDSLIQEERKARDKFTRIQFETKEVTEENAVLNRKRQIWIGIAFGVFLLGLAVYIIINQRAKNQALRFQQQQQASNQEIFDLMLSQKQKIEDTKKMEQKRISEELHDGVLGKMLGARMVLTGLNKRTNEEAVEERAIAISALKDVEGEVRAISHELSHAAYQNINNFINSIKDLLQSVSNASGIAHAFDYDESFDWDSMKGDMKINLYRIIQETLQNAVKHSECKKILVNFVRTNDLLNVTIADDGKGFKAKAGKKGIGMRNIESRVGKLNGTWDIDSIVDMGTTITFNIPLKDYAEHRKIIVEEKVLKNIE